MSYINEETRASFRPTTTFYSTDPVIPFVGGSYEGHVSGTIASLAASTTVYVVFDLGPTWQYYTRLIINYFPAAASGTCTFEAYGSNTTSIPTSVDRLSGSAGSTAFNTLTITSGSQALMTYPTSRYLHIRVTNGTTALLANSAIKVTMYII